jgi:rRNA N6-adenosine-methyltransferase METTL5
MLYTIQNTYEDLEGKTVADLGCGCGVLSVGAKLLDAEYACTVVLLLLLFDADRCDISFLRFLAVRRLVLGVDVDEAALETAAENYESFEVEVESMLANVEQLPLRAKSFDTVVMNPPFGTKLKGIGTGLDFSRFGGAPILADGKDRLWRTQQT